MVEIKNTQMIRDALGSPIPQKWVEESQTFIASTVDGSVADLDFSKTKMIRDRLGSPIPQKWDNDAGKFVPSAGGVDGEVTIESIPGLQTELNETAVKLAETAIIKADKEYVDIKVNAMTNGAPKLVVQTAAELPSTVVSGDERLALVLGDGHKYFHNGTAWVDAGIYQAVSLGAGAVAPKNTTFITQGKNLINPEELLANTRLLGTGAADTRAGFYTTPYLEIGALQTHLTQSLSLIINFYSTKDVAGFISGQGNVTAYNAPRTIEIPAGAKYFRTGLSLQSYIKDYQVEYGTVFTGYEPPKNVVKNLGLPAKSVSEVNLSDNLRKNIKKTPILTLNDAWIAWVSGEKFPLALYSDSATDGVGTTDWVANVLGADSPNINAYPKLLENRIRAMTGNSLLRIYNAGFSGKTAKWGVENFEAAFGGSSVYNDAKMIGLGFGINDRIIYSTVKAYRDGFKADMIALINKCYDKNIQPFLLTTQAILSPDVRTTDLAAYPLRNAQQIATVANEVKKELAKEYSLELIDVNKFTEDFLLYSQVSMATIIADKLHFGDVGHKYEADVLFAKIVPYTNFVKERTKLDYSSQRIFKGVPEEWVTNPPTFTGEFKTRVNTTLKGNTNDLLIYSIYVFIDAKRKMTLKAYKNDASTLTYVKVNGVVAQLDALEKTIGDLDLGLYHLEVWTGLHGTADFKGFIIE